MFWTIPRYTLYLLLSYSEEAQGNMGEDYNSGSCSSGGGGSFRPCGGGACLYEPSASRTPRLSGLRLRLSANIIGNRKSEQQLGCRSKPAPMSLSPVAPTTALPGRGGETALFIPATPSRSLKTGSSSILIGAVFERARPVKSRG
jgi:hypothetical protein